VCLVGSHFIERVCGRTNEDLFVFDLLLFKRRLLRTFGITWLSKTEIVVFIYWHLKERSIHTHITPHLQKKQS
jgi:hypothetical protein